MAYSGRGTVAARIGLWRDQSAAGRRPIVLGLLLGAGLAVTAVPSMAAPLTAAEIETNIIGKTVCIETPRGEVCVRHEADGVTHSVSGMPDQTGTWRLDGDQHCVTWKGAEERCTIFEKTDAGYATAAGPVTLSD